MLRDRLTYANVMATVAVFIAIGGGAYAVSLGKNSVGPAQIKKNAVRSAEIAKDAARGRDVRESSLGQVPSAASADSAAIAGTVSDNAITSAKIADGSVGSADLSAEEAFRQVGTGSEPGFGNGGDGDCNWFDFGGTNGIQPVAFWKDKLGVVHLTGAPAALNGAGGDAVCDVSSEVERVQDFTIFTLPPGYRPDNATQLPVAPLNGGPNQFVVVSGDEDRSFLGVTFPAGTVISTTQGTSGGIWLEGLTFRASGN